MNEFIQNFHFLRPYFLVLGPIALALVYGVHLKVSPTNAWHKYIHPSFLKVLKTSESVSSNSLLLFSALLIVLTSVALAGPSWEKSPQPVIKKDTALIIILDLSPSMNATDMKPSRLTRARYKIVDLLNRRIEGQTALLVYSEDAHVVSPLTDDVDTIKNLLPALKPEIMPEKGSRIESAISLATEMLSSARVEKGKIIVVTDGIAPEAESELRQQLLSTQHKLAIWAFGTETGAPIELSSGGFAKKSNGAVLIAKLDDEYLAALSRRLNAFYINASNDDLDIGLLLDYVDSTNTKSTQSEILRNSDQWKEFGIYIVIPLLFLFPLIFRRGWLLCIALIVPTLYTQPSTAFTLDEFLMTEDQRAQRAYDKGNHALASELFKREDWKAAAQFKTGDYASAAEHYANGNSAEDAYNLGNALALQGNFQAAINAYENALKIKPGFDKAVENKALAEKLLREQSEQQNQQGQQGQQGQQDSEPTESQKNKPFSGDMQENMSQNEQVRNGQSEGESQTADSELVQSLKSEADRAESEEKAQNARDELSQTKDDSGVLAERESAMNTWKDSANLSPDEQKLEQWLREIPDDPSGLLRKKFELKSQQRRADPGYRWRKPPTEEQRW